MFVVIFLKYAKKVIKIKKSRLSIATSWVKIVIRLDLDKGQGLVPFVRWGKGQFFEREVLSNELMF